MYFLFLFVDLWWIIFWRQMLVQMQNTETHQWWKGRNKCSIFPPRGIFILVIKSDAYLTLHCLFIMVIRSGSRNFMCVYIYFLLRREYKGNELLKKKNPGQIQEHSSEFMLSYNHSRLSKKNRLNNFWCFCVSQFLIIMFDFCRATLKSSFY